MIWRRGGIGVALVVWAAGALADAPETSVRPAARPAALAAVLAAPVNPAQGAGISLGVVQNADQPAAQPAAQSGAGAVSSPFPRPRPQRQAMAEPGVAEPQMALASTSAAAISPAPKQRRGLFGLGKAAVRTQPDTAAITGKAGSVCGVPGIKGRKIPPIASRVQGCGVADPVEITSVDGIALTTPAKVDCPTAIALNAWVRGAVKPGFANKGGGLEALRVAADYVCRPRNNVAGARISEHGKGKAIDISGFLLASGAEVTVAGDYRRGAYSKVLKSIHRAACGPFGTTLGPGSDGMHENHLHLDTAAYRSGSYCK